MSVETMRLILGATAMLASIAAFFTFIFGYVSGDRAFFTCIIGLVFLCFAGGTISRK